MKQEFINTLIQMEGHAEESDLLLTSHVLEFMRSHRALSLRDALGLYFQAQVDEEEERYQALINEVQIASERTLERARASEDTA